MNDLNIRNDTPIPIEDYKWFVVYLFRKYYNGYYYMKEDLISAGTLGMLEAYQVYKPTIKTSFLYFSQNYICRRMSEVIRQDRRYYPLIDVPIKEKIREQIFFKFINKSVDGLKLIQQVIIKSKYFDGYNYRKIAGQTGYKIKEIKSLEKQALDTLREKII